MSWSGFKKNVGRATTQVMMKTGHVEKTNDREYEVEERRYRTLESASLRLQKEAKGYLDSLRAMTASQMRIAETIDAFYGDSGASDGVSRSYKQAVEDLDAETVKALDGPYRYLPSRYHNLIFDELTGCYDLEIKQEIEHELNFVSQTRVYTAHFLSTDPEFTETFTELTEYIYRTTVLEPISRFCAYFPDINECIKKRNHKMLDYDAMRSKVKKLAEKPDKDPTKLPRAEKETEMVGIPNSLVRPSSLDLSFPSPPKVSNVLAHFRTNQGSSSNAYASRPSTTKPDSHQLRSLSGMAFRNPHTPYTSSSTSVYGNTGLASRTRPAQNMAHAGFSHQQGAAKTIRDDAKAQIPKTHVKPSSRPSSDGLPRRSLHRTPFFNPSELEDALQPYVEQVINEQADSHRKAKAAYEQLNEQLTTELPQLIDLRVPYLDPSFEALVKIQLRFCAEAYSRMAQVQQFLDASTRDQYASGDLDAKVEDVLGQIRELSIAGTV